MAARQYVIVGSSAAGIAALTTIRRFDADTQITLLTQDTEYPYNLCKIIGYMAGQHTNAALRIITVDRLQILVSSYLQQAHVERIDRQRKVVYFRDTQNSTQAVVSYDTLLLATGGRCIPNASFSIAQQKGDGLYCLYTLQDAEAIKRYVQEQRPRTAVVIGGGFTGLECAAQLAGMGLCVTIIERAGHIAPVLYSLSASASEYVGQVLRTLGVTLYSHTTIQNYIFEHQAVESVEIMDAITGRTQRIDADLVIWAAGMMPNISLAQDAGIACNAGILINSDGQTSDSAVYAAGDCAEVSFFDEGHIPSHTWAAACEQGVRAGYSMLGREAPQGMRLPMITSYIGQYIVVIAGAISASSKLEHRVDGHSVDQSGEYVALFSRGFIYIGCDIQRVAALRTQLSS